MSAVIGIVLIVCCSLALMALEAFIPGVSIAGVFGVALYILAAYICFSTFGMPATILLIAAECALSFLIMRLVFRSMKSGKLSRAGIFMNEPVAPAVNPTVHTETVMNGSIGYAKSALRPSGIAEFEGRRIHVVSGNGFIEKNAKVTVVRKEGTVVTVVKTDE